MQEITASIKSLYRGIPDCQLLLVIIHAYSALVLRTNLRIRSQSFVLCLPSNVPTPVSLSCIYQEQKQQCCSWRCIQNKQKVQEPISSDESTRYQCCNSHTALMNTSPMVCRDASSFSQLLIFSEIETSRLLLKSNTESIFANMALTALSSRYFFSLHNLNNGSLKFFHVSTKDCHKHTMINKSSIVT